MGALRARAEDDDFGRFLKLSRNDAQTILDVAFDYSDAGCDEEAIELLRLHHREPVQECPLPNPLSKSQSTRYALAWLLAKGVTAPIASASRPEQLDVLLAAPGLSLSEADVEQLDAASAGF